MISNYLNENAYINRGEGVGDAFCFEVLVLNRRADELTEPIKQTIPYARVHGVTDLSSLYGLVKALRNPQGILPLADNSVVVFGTDFLDDKVDIKPDNLLVLKGDTLSWEDCSQYGLAHALHTLSWGGAVHIRGEAPEGAPAILIAYSGEQPEYLGRGCMPIRDTLMEQGIAIDYRQVLAGISEDDDALAEHLLTLCQDYFEEWLIANEKNFSSFDTGPANHHLAHRRTMLPHLSDGAREQLADREEDL